MSRPRKLSTTAGVVAAMRYQLYRQNAPKRICAELGISDTTLRNYLKSVRARES